MRRACPESSSAGASTPGNGQMYRITLYDECCFPICDGTASFFVESLELFEEHRLARMQERHPEQAERYLRSKAGEIVTDYYSDDPELNIVQRDDRAEILEEQTFEEKALDITLYNIYDWGSRYYFDRLSYTLRRIRFKGKDYTVASYEIEGGCTEVTFLGKGWDKLRLYGNKIADMIYDPDRRERTWDKNEKPFEREEFSRDRLTCFMWVMMPDMAALRRLDEEELGLMLRDIPGEGG